MMKYIYLLLITGLFISCNKYKEDGIIDRRTVELKEYADSAVHRFNFPCERLPLTIVDADGIIKEDSLLIFVKLDANKKFHIYNANSYDSLGAYVTKGRGPDEVLLLGPRVDQVIKDSSGIKLVIQSFPQYMALLNVSKTLKEKKVIIDRKYDFTAHGMNRKMLMYESSTFSILPDGKFFAAQNPNLANRKIINPCFFIYDYEKNSIIDSLPRTSFKEKDVKHSLFGSCYFDVNGYQVCAAFRFIDAVKIFDLKTKKNIVVKMSPDYPYKGAGKEYSTNMVVTPEYIFRLSKERINDRLITNMHILNWKGDILGKFHMGHHINSIWINTEDKAMYAVTLYNGEVYKYNLEELYQ